MHSVLRAFRSDAFRQLARDATRQGWQLYINGNGHADAVSPSGQIVRLSTTAHAGGDVVKAKRREFERAGLTFGKIRHPRSQYPASYGTGYASRSSGVGDPSLGQPAPDELPIGPVVEQTLDERRSEVDPMAATSSSPMPIPTALVPPKRGRHVDLSPRASSRRAGGAYAYVGGEEITIHGIPVKIRERADGQLMAIVADKRASSGRKQWSGSKDRAELVGRVTTWIEAQLAEFAAGTVEVEVHETPAPEPKIDRPDLDPITTIPSPVEPDVPEPAPDVEIEVEVDPGSDRKPANGVEADAAIWAAVRVDPSDYPIAAALEELDRAVAPAIAALEASGKLDAAALVRGELQRTPAEDELLRLWCEIKSRPRLEHRA